MFTLFAILVTWYLTKIYYTRSARVNMNSLGGLGLGLVRVQCSKCSQTVVTSNENLRVPFYCSACK